jgi:hypothetical protein
MYNYCNFIIYNNLCNFPTYYIHKVIPPHFKTRYFKI